MKALRITAGLLAFLFGLMLVIFIGKDLLQHRTFDMDIGFLALRQEVISQLGWLYLPAFYVHITSATLVAFLGLFQFSRWLRQKAPGLHRGIGKGYVLLTLALAAPSGFVMAWFATGGFWGILCFLLLAVGWWTFTFLAWRKVVRGDLNAHRKWMIRSYALTVAALLLRFYLALSSNLMQDHGPDVYVLLAWASWVPNLIVVEVTFRIFPGQGVTN